ncbi:hypothetical protein DXF96_11500 [Heyndrickxia coagulans]|nr:hypothetical protein CYJ15_05980 [Heyndrickxia coagulans]QDI62053.1 hypothetical protein DXF96_11500 [Heyndrickxia coagulans]
MGGSLSTGKAKNRDWRDPARVTGKWMSGLEGKSNGRRFPARTFHPVFLYFNYAFRTFLCKIEIYFHLNFQRQQAFF